MTTFPAANKPRGGRIPVRGKCPDGHVTETISDPGRITWDGQCAADGCTHRINARRIPAHSAEDASADVHTPPEPESELIREVDYAKQAPRSRRPAEPSAGGPVSGTEDGPGAAPVLDVDERTADVDYGPGPADRPRGVVDEAGSGLVDQRPPRQRRERPRERHVFGLPWE